MRILVILAGLLGLSVAASADVGGSFSLERLAERSWRARYCFSEPVDVLSFARPIKGMRARSWRSADAAFQLEHQDEVSKLSRVDGAPFSCASVDIATDTMIPEKNYMPFSTFSDGGVSVYTGYMTGQVFVRGQWQDYELKATYTGLEGDRIITRNPDILGHQFVYFGHQAVKDLPEATLVVDSAIPASARLGVLTTLPRANKLLRELFGYIPTEPYMVFMAAGELQSSAADHTKGGTQPYQILFTMKGKGSARWADSDPLYFPRFTMHEVLHIWQNDVWGDWLGADQPWVHEGGAEALAYELMNKAGAYKPGQLDALWATVSNKCRNLLVETSVHGAAAKGRFDTVYQCGALINRMVGAALNADAPGDGMIRFWSAMAEAAPQAVQMGTSEQLYLDTLDKVGFAPGARTALQAFLGEKPASPDAALKTLKAALVLSPQGAVASQAR